METLNINNSWIGKHNFIIQITLNDWSIIYPVYVNWNNSLEEAIKFFSSEYRWKWIVETIIDDTLFNSIEIKNWNIIKQKVLENENNDKVWKLLKELDELGVWTWLIKIIRKDLQVEDNKKLFETYVELSNFSQIDKEKVLLAMNMALEAHKWQIQKRPQDKEWLDNIPYSNHPIQVAKLALNDLKMSAWVVEVSLLHDVIEDTNTTIEDLKEKWFSNEVIQMVLDCTRREDETREDFMKRVKNLKWDSKIIKCLDRYHNIIRAFSIKDSKYILKILTETKEIYLEAFEDIKELEPLRNIFFDLLIELEKYYDKLKN